MVDRRIVRTILAAVVAVILAAVAPLGAAFASGTSEGAAPAAPAATAQEPARTGTASDADLAALQRMQNSFRAVASKVLPVVVQINVVEVIRQQAPEGTFDFFFNTPRSGKNGEFRRPGLGSGVIVRQAGDTVYVLTNNHVVGDAEEISIRLHDQRTFKGELVGKDPRMDLALVKFQAQGDIPVAELGDSDSLQVGDWALAVGNPLGLESTLTAGIVSALGRTQGPAENISDFIQTDAAINPGNSGGALVNIYGEVVGINTWIASTTGSYIGFGFAIPINNAKKDIDDLVGKGKVEYGWLGVSIQDPPEVTAQELKLDGLKGGLITNVYRGSPADKGGILPGDYVTRVNQTAIHDTNALVRTVGVLPTGKPSQFTITRYGEKLTLTVTTDVREEDQKILSNSQNMWPGLLAISSQDASRIQPGIGPGVVVVSVYENTPAGKAGIQQMDLIQELGGRKITTEMDFFKALNESGAQPAQIRLQRKGAPLSVELKR